MKAKEVIAELSKLNPESDVFISTDGKLTAIEQIANGQFFRSANIITKIEYDVVRAEQTLLSCLAYQRDQLNGLVLDRIERALGKERVTMITAEFDRDKSKKEKEAELNKDELDNLEKALNQQQAFVEETSVEKPKKRNKKLKLAESSPVSEDKELSQELAEQILSDFYSGSSPGTSIDSVKDAKRVVGEERAREIFNKVRNG